MWFACYLLHAQTNTAAQAKSIDSLKTLLKTSKADTNRINILFSLMDFIADEQIWYVYNDEIILLSEKLLKSNDEQIKAKGKRSFAESLNYKGIIYSNRGEDSIALVYYHRSLKLWEEIGDLKFNALLLNNIGNIFYDEGNVLQAIECFEKSLSLQEKIGNKNGIGLSLNNLAGVYTSKGDIKKALTYFSRSLKIQEETKNTAGISACLSNIGFIYFKQGEVDKALDYFNRSLVIRQKTGDKLGMGYSLNNIGVAYKSKKDIAKALEYFEKSLKIREEILDKKGVALSLNNIGEIYSYKDQLPIALTYFEKCLRLNKELDNKVGMADSYNSIGAVYLKQKKYPLAFSFTDSSLVVSKALGFPEIIRNAELTLSRIDSARANYSGAFAHYKQFIKYRDSLNNEGTRKASLKNQLNYEFEKKEAILKEQQEKEKLIAEEKNRFQKIVIFSVVAGLLLVVTFMIFILRTLKVTKHQKVIIEEKQKEILDSIHYAKRIQKSLLPTEKYIERNLKRSEKDS